MNKQNLRISIADFRAIRNADISLNGISVLSGINGSGKSTVSRLVYDIIRSMKGYNFIVLRNLRASLLKYFSVLENLILTAAYDFDAYEKYSSLFKLSNLDILPLLDSYVSSSCDIILKAFKENQFESEKERQRRMIINTINGEDSLSIEDALDKLKSIVHQNVVIAQENVKKRPFAILADNLDKLYGSTLSKSVSMYEYGESIFSVDRVSVPIPHYVNHVFYIDTPFALEDTYYQHWLELNEALKNNDYQTYSSISSFIGKRIVKGVARYESSENYSGYLFKDTNGNDFELRQAATGIKSFSIIQMLLNNGQITEDTLLILDEPEVHLHPQWIVEFARVIVMIHKIIGTKFLISSHNPDMVSAIRYIAESEGCLKNLEFYVAKRAKDGIGHYSFKSTGLNIEPIFKSFNKSYERLTKYVADNGSKEEQ